VIILFDGNPKGFIVNVIENVSVLIVYENEDTIIVPITKEVTKFKFFPLIVNVSPNITWDGVMLVIVGDGSVRTLESVLVPSLIIRMGFLTETTGT